MFEKKSSKAQWEIVTEVFSTKKINDIVTDEELLIALGSDFPVHSLHSVVNIAIKRYRENKRTFERVRTVGWRMVEAREHSRLARKQQKRGERRLADAVSIVGSVDMSLLSLQERREAQAYSLHLSRLRAQVSRRADRIENSIDTSKEAEVVNKGEIDERLSRLEKFLSLE